MEEWPESIPRDLSRLLKDSKPSFGEQRILARNSQAWSQISRGSQNTKKRVHRSDEWNRSKVVRMARKGGDQLENCENRIFQARRNYEDLNWDDRSGDEKKEKVPRPRRKLGLSVTGPPCWLRTGRWSRQGWIRRKGSRKGSSTAQVL